jgi:transmembrane sensor
MTRFLDEVEDAAAAWDAKLRGGTADFRERRAFHDWLDQDPEHQAAHDRLQAALSGLRAHVDLPELSALRDEARNSVQENRRRRLASLVSAVAAAVVLVVLVFAIRSERGAELAGRLAGDTVYATPAGERARVTLADGSVVTLDGGTRLSTRLSKSRRDVTLLAGHALFQVAKDRRRPFVVKAKDRTITALGTVFDVRLSPRELRVTLAEGAVAVRPLNPSRGRSQQVLKPREQFVERTGTAATVLRAVDTEGALGWADSRIFFENEPLAKAIEEMNGYSHLKMAVDPAVAHLRINGMFRTSNQRGFLDALEKALPVEVQRDAQGQILVSARPGEGIH